MPHSIRLREPWQLLDQPTWAEMSGVWVGRFSRRFNKPTGLTATQSVMLFIELQPDVRLLLLQLNGQELATASSASTESNSIQLEIRASLLGLNELQLTLAWKRTTENPPRFPDCASVALLM